MGIGGATRGRVTRGFFLPTHGSDSSQTVYSHRLRPVRPARAAKRHNSYHAAGRRCPFHLPSGQPFRRGGSGQTRCEAATAGRGNPQEALAGSVTLSDDIKGFDLDHVRHERQIVVEVPDLPFLLLTAGVNPFDQHRSNGVYGRTFELAHAKSLSFSRLTRYPEITRHSSHKPSRKSALLAYLSPVSTTHRGDFHILTEGHGIKGPATRSRQQGATATRESCKSCEHGVPSSRSTPCGPPATALMQTRVIQTSSTMNPAVPGSCRGITSESREGAVYCGWIWGHSHCVTPVVSCQK